ncbi:alpha/beta hydrolase [Muricauda sp. SCSIO 64092]|uniref:alpha/beta fold hydrolase n=1 Tax=Allomuricauda sp. SCSIO 64092 TaxID=2908842 RepID=UPI001FF2DF73|nr:alpha/beta fold hydrolase [Muricauda sp. SCSIO 64092]UOY06681.1 alpha/beta hydrolase [Muricauda sp. SCSIO 64092]
MRTSPRKTKLFFAEKNIAFVDSAVRIKNRTIRYIQTGSTDKQTLVFVHGSPGSWDAWKSYLSDTVLLKHFRMIAPDRPGFGFSNFRKSSNLDEQALLLNALVSQLKNGEVTTLVGHSYGGPLIVKMALQNPSLFHNLYILAGAVDPEAEKPEKWRKPLTWVPLKYLVPGALKPSNDEIWMLKKDLWNMKPGLAALYQNTVIIHGTKDKLVPYSNVDFMQKEFVNVSNLEVIRIEDENHFIVWNREGLIKEKLLDLVK